MERDIFISHRHADKEIANVLRKHLLGWGISTDRIFLSSSVENAPQIGGALQGELQKALQEARVLFFLFTSSGADWSWCIYEIGLATDPETPTRIVVIKCTDDAIPHVVKDQVVVYMTNNSIKRLVKQFHKDKGFFPGQPAFSPDLDSGALADRSKRLFEELREVIPRESEHEIIRWGSFLVGIDAAAANGLAEASLEEIQSEKERTKLMNQCKIVEAKGWGIQHFGYNDFADGLNLAKVAERWTKEVGDIKEPSWMAELSEEFWNVATNRRTKFRWVPFKSLALDDLSVCPVVTEARRLKNGGMQFKVLMFYFQGESSLIEVRT